MAERFPYEDIINIPRHISKVYPQASMADRAARFSPFAAISGYEDMVREAARVTEERVEITDAAKRKKDLYVTVLGTRKNTFGPLHVLPCVVHRCGHGSFTTSGDEWTDDYNLISDGLREIRFDIKK